MAKLKSILPDKPTSRVVNPASLSTLLIAEPKWGKTSFFMSNPNAILLGFEDGHKFHKGHKLAIDAWDAKGDSTSIDAEGVRHVTFMQAIDALEDDDRFDMVIIDTADLAVKMCSDYNCAKKGVEHASDYGQMGKGWDLLITTPFRKAVMRLLKTGRGVAFTTHAKHEILRFTAGEKARKESTLTGGPMRFIYGLCDLIAHGEYGKKQPGNKHRDRVLVTDGDADILAGNRAGAAIPPRYIVSPTQAWKQFANFFKDPKATAAAELEYAKKSK